MVLKQGIALLLITGFFFQPLNAQKVLQLERTNRARTLKLPIGETIVYRMDETDAVWEKDVITDLDVEGQRVKLGLIWIKIDDIAALKRSRNGAISGLGYILGLFGISWVGYSAVGEFLYNDDEINWKTAAIIAGTTVPAGLLMNTPRVIRMGKKHRLRALDVTYPGTEPRN